MEMYRVINAVSIMERKPVHVTCTLTVTTLQKLTDARRERRKMHRCIRVFDAK